jgi:DNA-binding IclR family transcriptional regulator
MTPRMTFQQRRAQILDAVSQADGCTIRDVMSATRASYITVQQHLASLAREGVIRVLQSEPPYDKRNRYMLSTRLLECADAAGPVA